MSSSQDKTIKLWNMLTKNCLKTFLGHENWVTSITLSYNTMTNNSSFVGDVDVKWRLSPNGNTYLKAYNLTNDRYFTKSTLNTQGIGATYQKDFESWKDLFRRKHPPTQTSPIPTSSDSIETDSSHTEDNLLILQDDTTQKR